MEQNKDALKIAEKLQKDIEIWHLDQTEQINELKKTCQQILDNQKKLEDAIAYMTGKPQEERELRAEDVPF